MNGAMQSGEEAIFHAFPDRVEFRPIGDGFIWATQHRAQGIASAPAAWDEVRRMIADELNIVLRCDYLPLEEVLAALAAKPAMTHVVVTGRNAPAGLIDAADVVTDMTQVKHPSRSGMKAQAVVEF